MDLFLQTLVEYAASILPWLVGGVMLAFVIERLVNPHYIKKYFSKTKTLNTAVAMLLGMISPLSIMSFLPIAGEFVRLGANPSMLFSFFIAERAYDFQSFFIISTLFGYKFAVLNAIAIFCSLFCSALILKNEKLVFTKQKKGKSGLFLIRQIKLFLMVCMGILIGALLKVSIPETLFNEFAGTASGGLISAVTIGFSVYFGPILSNYPVAKAFSELGMSQLGVLGFMTISPIFNFIVILLFSTLVGVRRTLKPILVYTATALVLTICFSYLL